MNKSSALRALRWVLTVPAGIAGWYLGVMLTLGILYLVQGVNAFMQTGVSLSEATWYPDVENMAIAAGSIFCGALVVWLPALMAPAHRDRMALLAYVIGLACAMLLFVKLFWQPVAWSALSGAVVCWRLQGFHFARRAPHRNA
jgi:hypothetical protein